MKIEERNGSRFLCCDYTNGTTIVKLWIWKSWDFHSENLKLPGEKLPFTAEL